VLRNPQLLENMCENKGEVHFVENHGRQHRTRESFWEQPRIQKAIQYVEAWAILRWHQLYGGVGFPAEEVEHQTSVSRRGSPSDMPSLFDAKVTVDYALKEIQEPWVLTGLLLWIYPRRGKFARNKDASTFRPATLKARAREFGWTEERLTEILKEDERRFLEFLAERI
jgi:hypothetical protein